jgi:AcrR family transcriptional regulator
VTAKPARQTPLASDPQEPSKPSWGRPRSAASEQAILTAALDLMAEGHGPASISIAEIARRAGAGKDTIYRRWHNKEDLLLDALAAEARVVETPDGLRIRDALVAHLSDLIARLQDDRYRAIMRSLQSVDDGLPKLRERYYTQIVSRRVDAIVKLTNAAVERGEINKDEFFRDLIEMPFHHVVARANEEDPVGGDPVVAAGRLVDAVLTSVLTSVSPSETSPNRSRR